MKKFQKVFTTFAFLSITSMANATVNFYNSGNLTNYMLSMADNQSITLLNSSYNDRISGISGIGGGVLVILFKNKNFTGNWLIAPNGNLEYSGMNDTASSIITTTQPIGWIYQHINGNGWSYPVTVGNIVPRLENINDQASSISVPSGYCLKMWVNSPPSDSSNYNNWYLNPSYVSGSTGLANLPSGIADEVSAVELVSCP